MAYIVSCTNSTVKNNLYPSDSIVVIFWKGSVDFNIIQPCSTSFKNASLMAADTIISIEKNKFTTIKKALKEAKVQKNQGLCNASIYVKTDSTEICLCDMNRAYNRKDEQIALDLYTIYLIKSESGFYNYVHESLLDTYEEIRKYGIPANHKYFLSDVKKPIRFAPTSKVILIKEE